MTHKLKFLGALAGLALAQAASAQQISKPLSALASNSATGKILCRGGSTVTMTADAEQSLPLRVVAILECGQEVSLLSAFNEGYTVNVHTADGKSGYVAWMNVAKGEGNSSRKTAPPPPRSMMASPAGSWTRPVRSDFSPKGCWSSPSP